MGLKWFFTPGRLSAIYLAVERWACLRLVNSGVFCEVKHVNVSYERSDLCAFFFFPVAECT